MASERQYPLFERLLPRATEFQVTPPDPYCPAIKIERGGDVDEDLWTIKMLSHCLTGDGRALLYEPLPSSRTDEFKARTRYQLADAVALCDRLELWVAQWVQGRGFVSNSFVYTEVVNAD